MAVVLDREYSRRQWLLLRRGCREGLRLLFDWIAPPSCAGCGDQVEREGLCGLCERRLEPIPLGGCGRCGEPLGPNGRCVADHSGLRGIVARRAPFRYRGTAGAIVRRFKFLADPAAEAFLVTSMVSRLRSEFGPGTRVIVVSVPMHPRKRRRRGRDPAAELAAAVADRAGLPFEAGALRRRVDTRPQADPRVLSRAKNVEGVFDMRAGLRLDGRTVVLVDDVSTSGATASACARVLRSSGAEAVLVLTAAIG